MSQKSDLEGVINFLRGGFDTAPETRRKKSAPDPTPENVELKGLQSPGGAGANDDETSSYKSAAPSAAPTRTSVERGDERRVVKYVPRESCFSLDRLYTVVETNQNLQVENSNGIKYSSETHNPPRNKTNRALTSSSLSR